MAKSKGKQKPTKRAPKPENPWDKQPGESQPAYAAFRTYLLMGGERSIQKVARELSKSSALMKRWSAANRWVGRVEAFEAEAARRQDEAALDELEQRARRQAELAVTTLEAMAAPSAELMRRLETKEGKAELKKLPLEQLVPLAATTARAIPRVVQTERLARGQSTTNVGGHRGGPIETDEQGRSAAARIAAEERVRDMPTDSIDAFLLGATSQRKHEEAKRAKAAT